jgi:hypothetical protein
MSSERVRVVVGEGPALLEDLLSISLIVAMAFTPTTALQTGILPDQWGDWAMQMHIAAATEIKEAELRRLGESLGEYVLQNIHEIPAAYTPPLPEDNLLYKVCGYLDLPQPCFPKEIPNLLECTDFNLCWLFDAEGNIQPFIACKEGVFALKPQPSAVMEELLKSELSRLSLINLSPNIDES